MHVRESERGERRERPEEEKGGINRRSGDIGRRRRSSVVVGRRSPPDSNPLSPRALGPLSALRNLAMRAHDRGKRVGEEKAAPGRQGRASGPRKQSMLFSFLLPPLSLSLSLSLHPTLSRASLRASLHRALHPHKTSLTSSAWSSSSEAAPAPAPSPSSSSISSATALTSTSSSSSDAAGGTDALTASKSSSLGSCPGAGAGAAGEPPREDMVLAGKRRGGESVVCAISLLLSFPGKKVKERERWRSRRVFFSFFSFFNSHF